MTNSIRLGQVRGITIRLHYSALFLLGLMLLVGGEWTQTAQIIVLFLAPIVLLHELGHSIVAQRFGIRVLDITFWPLGGMARMNQIPEDSRIEGLIAIAGPLVNLVLAVVSLPLLLLGKSVADPAMVFILINLMLGCFNLLPAFPMDGGRVLRAWLGRKGDWLRATEIAVRVGRWVAGAMMVGAFFWNPMLAFVAIFVWWAGTQELISVRVRHQGPAAAFGPLRAILQQAAAAARARQQPGVNSPFPGATPPPPAETESTPAQRPPVPEDRVGWSQEDLERLERFHGPLRKFGPDA